VKLNVEHADQLRKSFGSTSARVVVLTNGISYCFFSDLEEKNIMDDKPFMELNLLDIDEQIIPELMKISNKSFHLEQVFTAANELEYIRAIKSVLFEESSSPSLELIRYLAGQVYPGKKTQQVLEQFEPIVKEAFGRFVNDHLKSVMNNRVEGEFADNDAANKVCPIKSNNDRFITNEEFEGFFVVNVA
jgi:hypothetical protein